MTSMHTKPTDCRRYKWKETEFSFVRPSAEEEEALMDSLGTESHQRCYSCSLNYRDDLVTTCQKSTTSASLQIYGIEYHVGDFVYVKDASESILSVCQISDLSGPDQKVKLRQFLRLHEIQGQIRNPSDTVRGPPYPFFRRLLIDPSKAISSINR